MTVLTSANKAIIAGDGVKTAFAFSFNAGYAQGAPSPSLALSYLTVFVTDSSGNITPIAQGAGANQCQITLNAPAGSSLWGLGGTVNYNPAGTPIPLGSSLTVLRTIPLTQIVALANQGALFPQTVEMALDLLDFQIQQLNEQYGRAFVVAVSDPVPAALPPAAQRANHGAVFDANGNMIAGALPATGVISTAMQSVVSAASLAAGRTALGLGTLATEGLGAGLQDDGAGNARVIFGIQPVATNQAINAASFLQKYEATGTLTFTLARANTLWSGFGFWIDALTGPITLVPNAADTINAQTKTSGASVIIPLGTSVFVKTNALASGTWWIEWQLTRGAPSIAQFTFANDAGFVGDGVTDNAPALNAWLAALPAAGAALQFGVGKYVFNSAITKTLAAARQTVTIVGLGSDLSILHWPAGGGLKLIQGSSLNCVHIRDLTFTSGAVGAGVGLTLDSAGIALGIAQLSDITNVIMRGDDYTDVLANTHYWGIGVLIKGWCSVNVTGLTTFGLLGAPASAGGGVGFNVTGYGASAQAVVINLTGCSFSYHNVAVELDSYWEGIAFSQCNFQGEVGSVGLFVPAAQTNAGPLLTISGCQFNSGGQQVDFQSVVTQLVFNGNTVTAIGNNNIGLLLGSAVSPIVTGNMFNVASGTGTIGVQHNGQNGIVEGNIFVGLATGVSLLGSSANVNVSQNRYQGVTTPVTNAGTGNSVGLATN